MRIPSAITLGIALALLGHAAGVAAQDDLAACGRKAVEAGIGPGKVDEYVAACVAERKAGRESIAREKGKPPEQSGTGSGDQTAKEKAEKESIAKEKTAKEMKADQDKSREREKGKAGKEMKAAKDKGEDKMKQSEPKKAKEMKEKKS